jgi:hypothetical protein
MYEHMEIRLKSLDHLRVQKASKRLHWIYRSRCWLWLPVRMKFSTEVVSMCHCDAQGQFDFEW